MSVRGGRTEAEVERASLVEKIARLKKDIKKQKEEAEKDADEKIRIICEEKESKRKAKLIARIDRKHEDTTRRLRILEEELARNEEMLNKMDRGESDRQQEKKRGNQSLEDEKVKPSDWEDMERETRKLDEAVKTLRRESQSGRDEIRRALAELREKRQRIEAKIRQTSQFFEKEMEKMDQEVNLMLRWYEREETEMKENWNHKIQSICQNRKQQLEQKKKEYSWLALCMAQIAVDIVKNPYILCLVILGFILFVLQTLNLLYRGAVSLF